MPSPAAEVSLMIVLLAGAGIMVRSLLTIVTAEIGIETGSILTVPIGLPAATHRDPQAQTAAVERVIDRLQSSPGVRSVAVATSVPGGFTIELIKRPYEIAGAERDERRTLPTVRALIISPGYLRTLAMTLIRGRAFTDDDRPSTLPVVI